MTKEVRRAYRQLLRAVQQHVTASTGNGTWKEYAREQFRRHAGEKDGRKVQALVELAEEYATLVQDVHAHKELLFSYNIGVERNQREMIEKTARRVGLELPQQGTQRKPHPEKNEGTLGKK